MTDEYELVALPNGTQTLRSRRTGQTFHPGIGPEAEALSVHLAGTRLVERANGLPAGQTPIIWDVGLGAAANALAAVTALIGAYRRSEDIQLLSFDRSLEGLDFALAHASQLHYPERFLGALDDLRHCGETVIRAGALEAKLHWRAVVADFPGWLADAPAGAPPHAIFFDPYSPAVNPEMWTVELFSAIRLRLHDEAACILSTYTRSTAVRVTLLLAGFQVGIGPATGEKNETTVATNAPSLLERPLDAVWLENRVYASTNAAPLRTAAPGRPGPASYTRNPIGRADYEALWRHPQFQQNAKDMPVP